MPEGDVELRRIEGKEEGKEKNKTSTWMVTLDRASSRCAKRGCKMAITWSSKCEYILRIHSSRFKYTDQKHTIAPVLPRRYENQTRD